MIAPLSTSFTDAPAAPSFVTAADPNYQLVSLLSDFVVRGQLICYAMFAPNDAMVAGPCPGILKGLPNSIGIVEAILTSASLGLGKVLPCSTLA